MPSANVVQTSVSGGQQNALALQGDGVFLPKLSTATRTALTLGTSDKGFLAYDTTDNNVYIWNGAAWESIPASGDAGANGAVQYNDNGIIAGAANLFWDKANNRVGIGTASPAAALVVNLPEVSSAAGTSAIISNTTGGGNRIAALRLQNPSREWNIRAYGAGTDDLRFGSGAAGSEVDYLSIGNTGIFTWQNVGGVAGTAMTLNSTGLGVGASPSTRLHIQNTGDVYARIATTSVSKAGVQFSANGVVRSHLLYDDGAGTTYLTTGTSFGGSGQALAIQSGTSLSIYTNNQLATAQMTLDASGRLIINSSTFIPPTLNTNGELNFIATSNTNVRFSYRGTDGVTRVANITLA